jgi:hypothetical protein
MASIHLKPRRQAKFIVLDEGDLMIDGELDKRGNLTQFEARRGFILPQNLPGCTSEYVNTSQFPTELDQSNDHTSNRV